MDSLVVGSAVKLSDNSLPVRNKEPKVQFYDSRNLVLIKEEIKGKTLNRSSLHTVVYNLTSGVDSSALRGYTWKSIFLIEMTMEDVKRDYPKVADIIERGSITLDADIIEIE